MHAEPLRSFSFALRPDRDWLGFVDLELRLDLDDHGYDYSKLYYAFDEDAAFSEERVVCFRCKWHGRYVPLRLKLPLPTGRPRELRLRLDAIPYSAGRFSVRRVRLVRGRGDEARSRRAETLASKQWVRAQVAQSEATRRSALPHYPESLSVEITPRCNLTCGHCSSHGVADEHAMNNRRPTLDEATLDRLAAEVFPHLTLVNLVGRGEPTLVSDRFWTRLIERLEEHDVMLSCVTNGTLLARRMDERTVSILDTLTVSIDGAEASTFAANRQGASLDQVLAGVRHFHETRERMPLARRPRLGFSWTLKRNNIAEFPDFVRLIERFDPDSLYVRHLLVFHEKDREQSLIGHAELANPYLSKAYELLRPMHLKADLPPLMSASATTPPSHAGAAPDPATAPRDAACLFVHRTGVVMADGQIVTCGNMYAERAGRLSESTSFLDVWNGDRMQSVRSALGTDREWRQCRSCWYREIKYHSQRGAWSARDSFPLERPVQYSEDAWDFRAYR